MDKSRASFDFSVTWTSTGPADNSAALSGCTRSVGKFLKVASTSHWPSDQGSVVRFSDTFQLVAGLINHCLQFQCQEWSYGQVWLFLSSTGIQRMQRKIGGEKHKKDAKQTCLGFPLRDLLYGAIKVHFSSQEWTKLALPLRSISFFSG